MLHDRRAWIFGGIAIVAALIIGFFVGRTTATPDSADEAAAEVATTTTAATASTVPEYGEDAARDMYAAAVKPSLPPDATATDEQLLAAGDSVCADLEGFTNQGRDALYAIRILWRDELRYLDSTEVATYGVVLSAAPEYLCPQYQELALDIAYWLGI